MVEDGRQRSYSERPHSTGMRMHPGYERPLGELFSELADETKTLVQQEVALARIEMKEAARQAVRGASFTAAGGMVAYAGLIAVLVAAGLLLGTFMPVWLGFLIVGALGLLIGYAVLQAGLNRLQNTELFPRTAESLQEDKLWIQREVQDVKQRGPADPPRRRSVR